MSDQRDESSEINTRLQTSPVAIIGIASIFPQARTLPEYWDNLLRKIDCITDVPASRWNVEDYYDPNPSTPDKTYCKRGGFIPDIDFDPMEFGLPPNILEVTDVSQLLGLVVAKEALEDAGYGEGKEADRDTTGVILGVVGMSTKLFTPLMARLQYPVWEKVLKASGVSEADTHKIVEKIKLAYVNWEENSFPGSIGNVIAGRIANRFDLGGTNCVIDAACASSLAALRMAVGELVSGRANMMISGGVDTDNSIGTFMCFSKTPAFSKGDHVRTFDAASDGMMVGEGIGMVILKRLEDAERDHDRIYAVIRGIGSSSDGRFKSIYAPRSSGQAKAVRRAYKEAGFTLDSIGLIEAHGTGTMAGDPEEFQGLKEVFGPQISGPSIALGSVKSQIAHTKAAAGVASLIKVSLALYHKVLPATINVQSPNPKLDIQHSPFYLNTEVRPWIRAQEAYPRRAGVSSFGFGGTNFHVALEEYQYDHEGAYRLQPTAQAVLLSAPSEAELAALCQEMLAKLEGEDAQQQFAELAQSAKSAEIPQKHARLGFVAGAPQEAKELLKLSTETLKEKPGEDTWEHPKGIYYRKQGLHPKGKVVALFSGQGSQYPEMGRELYLNFPPMRQVLGSMDSLFLKDGLKPLSGIVFPHPVFDQVQKDAQSEALTRTEHAQPAIGSFSVGLYKLLQQAGFEADYVAGHSFGELTALWAGGVLSDQDYLALAKARGKAMAAPDDPNFDAGTMLAVKGDIEALKEDLKGFPEITLANYNSNNQVVLAGARAAIAGVQQALAEKGYSVVPLPVSAAFHTPLVAHAQKPFAKAIHAATFHAPATPVFSNTTGKAHSADPKQIQKTLEGHILNPVLFKDEIENIYTEGGSLFVEFGPKNVLTNLVKNILADKPHLAVALNANAKKDSDRQLRDAVVQLRVAGLALKDFDPYQAAPKPVVQKKKGLNVTLNGGYYMTEKTRAAFKNTLNDGFKVSLPGNENGAPTPASAPVEHKAPQPPAPQPAASPAPAPAPAAHSPALINSLENTLSQYQAHQTETLHLQEQYLQNEAEYARIFSQLAQAEISLVSQGNPTEQVTAVLNSLERGLSRFHDHQEETLRAHEQYLSQQAQFSQDFSRIVQKQLSLISSGSVALAPVAPSAQAFPATVPPAPAPVSVPAASVLASSVFASAPAAPIHTPSHNGNGSKPVPAAAPAVPVKPLAVSAPAAPALEADTLTAALLEVVSEKTGYPTEMLDLDMDMEADLGIDSIKRVEILGAMQSRFPELPKADAAALSEQRTLRQVVEAMGAGLVAQAPAAPFSPIPAPVAVPAPATSDQVAASPAMQAPAAVEPETISQALLEIVSEKTGYPTEMLELDMDMEADLGIELDQARRDPGRHAGALP